MTPPSNRALPPACSCPPATLSPAIGGPGGIHSLQTPSTAPPGPLPCPRWSAPRLARSCCVINHTHSSLGFSQASRNFPSSSSQWSRDTAQSCARSSLWWPSSSAGEAGQQWQVTVLEDSVPGPLPSLGWRER